MISNYNLAPLRLCAMVFFFIFLSSGISAQTAQEIETLLQTPAITYAQAARFALQASDKLTTRSQNEAFQFAQNKGWLPKGAEANTQARLDGVSLLLLNCFEKKGGLFYLMTSSSHYAYRELQYRNIMHGRTYPNQAVSGDLFLFMINRLISDNERIDARTAAADARKAGREAAARRKALAAEITAVLKEQKVQDTKAVATNEGVQITLSNIQFIADSAELTAAEREKIRGIANILKNLSGIKVQVTGHTALAGDEQGRYRISLDRARAVANQLVAFGACRASDISVIGMGAAKPIASNNTEEGMAANRRVEIMIWEQ